MPATLQRLVDRRLLRSDQRADRSYLELGHDSLVEPILKKSRARGDRARRPRDLSARPSCVSWPSRCHRMSASGSRTVHRMFKHHCFVIKRVRCVLVGTLLSVDTIDRNSAEPPQTLEPVDVAARSWIWLIVLYAGLTTVDLMSE